ncbi:precorrin-3B C(17)-methyltransferase [Notoacmeibacter marinus]|uniref:Precorrin-3B C(17)-methyltransferase n=1 Tax=Notoacmeibacter marinus TaxID=1876515 RepID=A0A231UYQ7_9HYPH|nr:precorrin-3B C(17)-methyltransferase [Notoacmeibacter marinus]OXT00476.1 precorrin-3B C(17)-methyltransferase [Notoacmeibacter marinus]
MTGRLSIIGLGPGSEAMITPQARDEVARAAHIFGYFPYVERLSPRPDQTVHGSDNREELDRARAALDLAARGEDVAMVSGGDPGVFAMAAAICETIDDGPDAYRAVELVVTPGVTAMLAVAAAAGAPLGHDFCAINLSDNLKPFAIIERRVAACAETGMAMAFYNPISRSRPWQLDAAFDTARLYLPKATPVIFGRAAGRPEQQIRTVPLSMAKGEMADMATCVIVGSVTTRIVERPGREPLIYTPRFWNADTGQAEPEAAQ